MKLVRSAHLVTALVSADGVTWKQVGAVTVPMTDVIHAGIAAATVATFDQVSVS